MTELRLAEGLVLPADASVSRLAFLGTTNSGKTYAATKTAELMWHARMQWVALDVMGIWWGLRLAADGEGAGIPVAIFGGRHADVAITEEDGAFVADVVFDRRISAIVDISEFETDTAKVRFAYRFAQRLYNLHKKSPRACHLFLEEAHEYLPQNPQAGDTQMLHEFNKIWKQGGNFGLGGSIISQRPQDVAKKSLDLTALVLAFNVTGTNALDSMRKWMGSAETSELPTLQRGECIGWSPSWLQLQGRFKIEPKETFHARFDPLAATLDTGDSRTLAPLDLEELREEFTKRRPDPISDDPAVLRAEIERLKKAGAARVAGFSQAEVDQFVKAATNTLRNQVGTLRRKVDEYETHLRRIDEIVSKALPSVRESSNPPPEAAAIAVETSAPVDEAYRPSRSQQAILDSLGAFLPLGLQSVRRELLAAYAGVSSESSGYANNLGALRTAGMIAYPRRGEVALSDLGRSVAAVPSAPPTLGEVHARWTNILLRPQGAILGKLIEAYPQTVTREALAEAVGVSAASSGYANNLGRLRSLGLLDYPRSGEVVATSLLFPEGLK